MLIDTKTTSELKDYAAILESIPDHLKDWYPKDWSCVLNLIDPLLFLLIYSCSKLCCQTSKSPQAVHKLVEIREFPGSLDKWHKALTITKTRESDYYIPTWNGLYDYYSSDKFSWLPSKFHTDNNGAVTIESYINNLHPVKHTAMYPVIANVFSKFLPLLEQVVTDLVHPHQAQVKPDSDKYYEQ
ncbi:hypothetical protein GGI17_005719 [Coemansia sp. S146]|nr:hypothetical protein GGI17_005719 [Coemansia sp. S146]